MAIMNPNIMNKVPIKLIVIPRLIKVVFPLYTIHVYKIYNHIISCKKHMNNCPAFLTNTNGNYLKIAGKLSMLHHNELNYWDFVIYLYAEYNKIDFPIRLHS